MNTPVDRKLFSDLKAVERYLGEPEAISAGFSSQAGIEVSISMGSRRKGFEKLREVITKHRRSWSERYLEAYLRTRWESDLKEMAWEVNRFLAAKGKLPTAKQFLGFGSDAVNHWFGGNISDAYAAFGEKSPVTQTRVSLMPANRPGFAALVFEALGGQNHSQAERFERREAERTTPLTPNGLTPSIMQMGEIGPDDLERMIRRLADSAPKYVQLQEALGRAPTPKELGAERWGEPHQLEVIWPKFAGAIESCLPPSMNLPPHEALQPRGGARRTEVARSTDVPAEARTQGSALGSIFRRLFGQQ